MTEHNEACLLEAVAEVQGEEYATLTDALENYSRREIMDIWLTYTGIVGYTDSILSALATLGYPIEIEDMDFFEWINGREL